MVRITQVFPFGQRSCVPHSHYQRIGAIMRTKLLLSNDHPFRLVSSQCSKVSSFCTLSHADRHVCVATFARFQPRLKSASKHTNAQYASNDSELSFFLSLFRFDEDRLCHRPVKTRNSHKRTTCERDETWTHFQDQLSSCCCCNYFVYVLLYNTDNERENIPKATDGCLTWLTEWWRRLFAVSVDGVKTRHQYENHWRISVLECKRWSVVCGIEQIIPNQLTPLPIAIIHLIHRLQWKAMWSTTATLFNR